MIPKIFALESHDLNNPLWIKLRDHYQRRLEELRARNDGDLSDKDTDKMRGRIAECKAFLNLGSPQQIIEE